MKNNETVSQKVAATGNVREVTDIAWSPSGDYLFIHFLRPNHQTYMYHGATIVTEPRER